MPDTLTTLQEALGDRFAFVRELGRGGMATVYLARDVRHDRPVAVKVLRTELAQSLIVTRFLKEIETAARLNHPHIVPLLDSGNVNGVLHFVMPYIEGQSVRALLNRKGTLDLDAAITIATETAGALTYAHRQGLIHRDIKPENILLSEGHAVVADFGIAKAISTAGGDNLTRTGFPIGTLGYMSPEQAAGATDLDSTTDVYSLATVVYEMIIGTAPGMWVTPDAMRYGRFLDALPEHREKLDLLPGSVEPVLVRAMAMRPSDRHQAPNEFAEALKSAVTQRLEFSHGQVEEIIRRASEAQADNPTSDAKLSIGSVERIAAEVGLPPARIREAASQLSQSVPEVPGGVFGAPSRLDLEQTLPMEVSPDQLEGLLEEIRHTTGEVGRINETLGSSLSWNSLSFQNSLEGSGRLIHVMVKPKDGSTRIRVTESAGVQPIVMVFGTVVGTVGITALLATVVGEVPKIVGVGLLAGAASTAFVGARAVFRAYIKRRARILSNMLSRMADQVVNPVASAPVTSATDPSTPS